MNEHELGGIIAACILIAGSVAVISLDASWREWVSGRAPLSGRTPSVLAAALQGILVGCLTFVVAYALSMI